MSWSGSQTLAVSARLGQPTFNGINLIKGTSVFKGGYYIAPYDGTYKFYVKAAVGLIAPAPSFAVYNNAVLQGQMTLIYGGGIFGYEYEYELTGVSAGDSIQIWAGTGHYYSWFLGVTEITDAQIAYGSVVVPHLHLPTMLQTDFIKMVCNMFGLVPDVIGRDHKIKYWNYKELYDNIPLARNWEKYLSETDNESEFKFGDYAQLNYMRYRESDDVIVDNGTGIMEIDDETLPVEKDVVELPVSTCDEVTIMTNVFSVDVSRIAFNKWNDSTALYDSQKTIDPRICYVDFTREVLSPPYEKTLYLTATIGGAVTQTITTPKKASSLEVSFSRLMVNYASLSRLLTMTNLRRDKFNLPVYEVSGIKHNVPIYLPQYKAYFYVNKISTYVPGKLCTIELIKL